MRVKIRPCAWKCGRKTDRRCRICIYCYDERDAKTWINPQYPRPEANRLSHMDWVPPDKRPGHRFFERKKIERTDAQKTAALELGERAKANARQNRIG